MKWTWCAALITFCVGELDAESPLACSFLITSGGSFEQSCSSERKKKKKDKEDNQKVSRRNPFLAPLDFFGRGWFEYLWVPNKGAYRAPSEWRRTTVWEKPLCFLKRSFHAGRFEQLSLLVSWVHGWIVATFLWQEFVGLMSGLLTPNNSHGLTHIWRSGGLSWTDVWPATVWAD